MGGGERIKKLNSQGIKTWKKICILAVNFFVLDGKQAPYRKGDVPFSDLEILCLNNKF